MRTDAVILAGGENKRISVPKGFLEINGERIIETNVRKLGKIFRRVIISTNSPELYFYLGVPMVGDVLDCRGPMTGIFSSLCLPEVSDIFVTACDMPYINGILVEYMMKAWDDRFDALVPVFDGKQQPLFSIYAKKLTEKLQVNLSEDKRSLTRFLEEISVQYVDENTVRKLDPEGRSFININTMEDFHREGGMKCLV